jgi:hypothetical protein
MDGGDACFVMRSFTIKAPAKGMHLYLLERNFFHAIQSVFIYHCYELVQRDV